jgi:hypothetical protein
MRSPTAPLAAASSTASPDLIDAIQAYLAAHNQNPQPFKWTATTDQILEKVRRGRVTLDAIAFVSPAHDPGGAGPRALPVRLV